MIHFISLVGIPKAPKRIEGQQSSALKQDAEIIAFKEILPSTEMVFLAFENTHPFQVSSFELALDSTLLTKNECLVN